MSEQHPQPRWWLLYPALPLAGALFWLIQRMRPVGIARDLLMIGALLVVTGYVEVWHLANTLALLHHPLGVSDGQPIYYARECAGAGPARAESRIRAVLVTDSHDDLFALPVYIGEASPAPAAQPGSEKIRDALAPQSYLSES